MDANTALEPAIAARSPAAGDDPALPCPPRWRRRDPAASGGALLEGAPVRGTTPDDPGHSPTGEPPEPAHHDAELHHLARRSQGGALRLQFELRTAVVRQIFRRDFVYVARQLHGLETSRRVQGLDRARLNDALATLQRRDDDVLALLRAIGTDLQSSIDAHGPAAAHIAFARAARFQATIVSPGARRYLALLAQADDTLARLELAWLLGLVAPATRTGLVGDCRRALHGYKDLASQLRQEVGEHVREVNTQRRQASASNRCALTGDDAADGLG